ncbi:MAG: hypothetical protein ACE5JL_04815 [Dehalococcoidia bacterium]
MNAVTMQQVQGALPGVSAEELIKETARPDFVSVVRKVASVAGVIVKNLGGFSLACVNVLSQLLVFPGVDAPSLGYQVPRRGKSSDRLSNDGSPRWKYDWYWYTLIGRR